MKFSANLGFLWADLPLPDAVRAAHRAGFAAVECHWPYDTPVSDLSRALQDTGLRMLSLNTRRGDVAVGENGLGALPGRKAEARAAIAQAVDYAAQISARYVHVMAGVATGPGAHSTFVENLRHACALADRDGLGILIEPLNAHDAPGYFLRTTDQARGIIAEVAAPNLRLMFDCYHVARTEGQVVARLTDLLPIIGHVQFASVPDRGPPDQARSTTSRSLRHSPDRAGGIRSAQSTAAPAPQTTALAGCRAFERPDHQPERTCTIGCAHVSNNSLAGSCRFQVSTTGNLQKSAIWLKDRIAIFLLPVGQGIKTAFSCGKKDVAPPWMRAAKNREIRMPVKPPLTDLPINTADTGFYKGFTKDVTITGKLLVGALIIWAVGFPDQAGAVLSALNSFILAAFNYWYVYSMAFFVILCFALAIWPRSAKMKLGHVDDKPEFSNFSWFSMMFGAGIGIGMLTFATAEPMYHWASNPQTIMGATEGSTADNVRAAYVWSFTHWGLAAWAAYAIVGLSLAFFAYRRNLPLTIRSALAPIFGAKLSGPIGHLVDIVAVVATVLGVAQTLGFGVDQFVSGLSRIGVGDWLYTTTADGGQTASTLAIIVALAVIMGASTLSALSGVGKGIKWLSNINMGLSFFLLAFFLIFGSTFFGLSTLFVGLFDYLISIPMNMFTVWVSDGVDGSEAAQLAGWQGGWTIFYWAWWIAFAPFVGVFLARISKGRTIREYVLGAMMIPALMCFVWFALVGGTAIHLELTGEANGAITGAAASDQLFATLAVILDDTLAWIMSVIVVILLLTYLVTTADSAVLIINTINAAGDEGPKARPHILFWGAALALVVGALIIAGGLSAIQTAMVIGALPFSLVMVLMGLSLIKAIWRDGQREAHGLPTYHSDDTASAAQPAE